MTYLTLRDAAPAKHSASHNHEKWQACSMSVELRKRAFGQRKLRYKQAENYFILKHKN